MSDGAAAVTKSESAWMRQLSESKVAATSQQSGSLKFATRVRQPAVLVLGMYSEANQKVQSSVGSTTSEL